MTVRAEQLVAESKSLRIGELATTTGVTPDTLRHYERVGLLPSPHRTAAGYRVYASTTVERLLFIKQAQRCGFSLAEIRALLALEDGNHRELCRGVERLLQQKLASINSQLAELRHFKRTLDRLARQCQRARRTEAEPECPVVAELGTARHTKGGASR